MVLEKSPTIYLKASECPVEAVTVFTTTAEVTRLVHVKLQEGTQDIVIKGFSEHVDANSLRISAGKDKLSILEVSYNQRQIPLPPEAAADLEEKNAALKELEGLEDKLRTRNIEIEESRKFLESYASRLTDTSQNTDIGELLSETAIKGIHQFMKIYRQKLEAIDFDLYELNKGLRDIRQQRNVLLEEIREIRKAVSEPSNEVTIAIFALEPASLILRLLYIVDKCKWTSGYDIRASAQEPQRVSVTYYGVIQQATGEDWEKAKITLSTSKPSISGTPPTLSIQTVQLRSNSPARPSQLKKPKPVIDSRSKRKTMDLSAGFAEYEEDYPGSPPANIAHDKTLAKSGVVFTVQNPTMIKCDDKPHKVTIVVTECETKFTHTCVPRLEPKAYLKAYITNSTDMPFLAGPAAIFYDHSYISTTQIQDISPQEHFEVNLGIDPAVKIDYKPLHRRRDTGGASKMNSQTFSHKIIVTNTRPAEADVIVQDQYPKSNDDKIRVRLIEPNAEEGPNHAVNDAHNIEWRAIVKSNHATEIPYSFAVDWPLDKEVDFSTLC